VKSLVTDGGDGNGHGSSFLHLFFALFGIDPYGTANLNSFQAMGNLFIPNDAWVTVANEETITEWSKGYLRYYVNSSGFLEYTNMTFEKSTAWGITNPINGKILLAPALFNGLNTNLKLGETIIHELVHFRNWKNGVFQGNFVLDHAMNEFSAYSYTASWTGHMRAKGLEFFNTILQFILNAFK